MSPARGPGTEKGAASETGGETEVQVSLGRFRTATAALLERAVRAALEAEGVRGGEISLTLVDDDAIRALNLRWLGKDRTTDVIAFSLGDADAPIGDVYLGVEQARRQAREVGVPPRVELVRLAIHGTLHVLGHDHPEGAERVDSPMFALQERLVRDVLDR